MDAFGQLPGQDVDSEGGSGGGGAAGFVNQVGLTLSGLRRFMKALSQ